MGFDWNGNPPVYGRIAQDRVFVEYAMNFIVELDQEEDGRWIAEVVEIPGALAYGQTKEDALARVEALALRVLADQLEHGEIGPDLVSVSFAAA